MKITRKAFLSLMMGAGMLPLVGAAQAQQGGPILIGATVPMTGPLSLTGKQYQNSLSMAEEDINKAGASTVVRSRLCLRTRRRPTAPRSTHS